MNQVLFNPKDIFLAALDHPSSAERSLFLRVACGSNPDLRSRVERLLEAHAQAGRFLGGESASAAEFDHPFGGIGTQVGPYTLLQKIGEGGMGVVYKAEQKVPFERVVALKIIKPGMDTGQVIARFEAERQALSLMDHPNIAKVLDAGITGNSEMFASGERRGPVQVAGSSGRPYFVMELVHGVPITRYCDEHALTPRQRLKLLLPVCHAIQHAHQKGIIHRDIKPVNILVAEYDQRAVPKVIDFGVAKAIGQPLSENTMCTGLGQIIGTLEYMSPEQARVNQSDIDTRSDIYSLGVLMYELLTGTTPIDRQRLRTAAFDEMLRIIREEEPTRPSIRLSEIRTCPPVRFCDASLGTISESSRPTETTLSTIAALRQTDPSRLTKLVRGELDWIVMKALEKDRNRRYETASAFAADIQRHLNDEPVEACPPSYSYQLRRFARHHAALLTTTTLVLISALIGTAVSVRYARLSSISAREADISAILARNAQAKAEEHAAAVNLARQWSQKLLYAADMKLASDAIASDDIPRAAELLARHNVENDGSDLRGFEWYYYHKRINVPPVAEMEPGNWIDDVEVSPDSRWLAASGPEGTLFVYDTVTWTKQREFVTESESVEGVAWSSDGERLAAACGNGELRVWNFASGELQLAIDAHPEFVEDVQFSSDGQTLYSCGDESVVRQWDAHTGAMQFMFRGHEAAVTSIAVSSDGQLLATASGDRTVAVWNTETRERLYSWLANDSGGRVLCVTFSPDSSLLAAGNTDGVVHLMDLRSGALQMYTQQPDGVESLTFLSDGRLLASADRGGSIQIHRVLPGTDGGINLRWVAHTGRALSLGVTPNGKSLISGGRDGKIRVWSPDPEAARWSVADEGIMTDFALSTDNQLYLSGSRIDRWDLMERRRIDSFAEINPADGHWAALVIAQDSDLLAAWQHPGSLSLFDLKVQHEVAGWDINDNVSQEMDVSQDGRWLALASATRADHVTLFGHGQTKPRRLLPAVQCGALAFSPDGHTLAAGQQNDVLLYSVQDNNIQPRVLTGHTNTVDAIAFNPDGTLVATVSHDRHLKVWRYLTGEQLFSLVAHRGRVHSVAISPDGRTIATGGDDRQIRLWHTATGQPLGELPAAEAAIVRVRFSPDGQRLVSKDVGHSTTIHDASPYTKETEE